MRLGASFAKVGARIDAAVGAGLSAPEGTEQNIEEVGQAEVLSVSAMVMVGCLEGWRLPLAGMSWRALSALEDPSVLVSLLEDSSSSPSSPYG